MNLITKVIRRSYKVMDNAITFLISALDSDKGLRYDISNHIFPRIKHIFR